MIGRRVIHPRAIFTAAAAATLFLAAGVPTARAGCVATYTPEYVQRLKGLAKGRYIKTSHELPAHITTIAQCKSYLASIASDPYLPKSTCDCSGSGGGGGGFSIPSGATPGQALALGIIGAALNSALAQPAGPSAAEIAQKKAEEEAARLRAEEEARRIAEIERLAREAELKRRKILAGGMKGVDGGSTASGRGAGGRLAMKGIDQDMTPPSAASGITPGSGTDTGRKDFGRIACAQALSKAASDYAGMPGREAAEKARFYAGQAEKALAGERLEVTCPATVSLPAVPDVPDPTRVYPVEDDIVKLREMVKVDLGFLDSVRAKKQELSERKVAVEAKKKEAEEKIAKPPEPPADGATAPDADRLKAEAEALLRESEAELAEITKDEAGLVKEEARLNDNLKRYRENERELEAKVAAKPGQ